MVYFPKYYRRSNLMSSFGETESGSSRLGFNSLLLGVLCTKMPAIYYPTWNILDNFANAFNFEQLQGDTQTQMEIFWLV